MQIRGMPPASLRPLQNARSGANPKNVEISGDNKCLTEPSPPAFGGQGHQLSSGVMAVLVHMLEEEPVTIMPSDIDLAEHEHASEHDTESGEQGNSDERLPPRQSAQQDDAVSAP